MVKQQLIIVTLAAVCMGGVSHTAHAADTAADQEPTWLASMVEFADTAEKLNTAASAPQAKGWEKPIQLGFHADYTVVTDYIWRGINYSEYRGEGREKLNHQMTVGVNYDTVDFGTIDFSVWFQWYGANNKITGVDSDGNLQEVDYIISWTYDLSKLNQQIPVELTLAWAGYDVIQVSGDPGFTNAFIVILALDDQKLLGENWFSLSPTLTYEQDIDDVASTGQGSWLEFGVSHEFELAKCPGARQLPIIRDLTLTPSWTLMTDIGYVDSGTRISSMRYGLNVGYDLSEALGIPEQYGSVGVSGFLNYSDAIADDSPSINLNDELWGGFSIGWEW
jgi:hypothetical protein